MYEAYKGIVDYGGESIDDAKAEIAGTLEGKYGNIIQKASLVAEYDGKIVSAIIFNWLEKEAMPLLTFTMTRAEYKGMGFAKKLIKAALHNLALKGYKSCCLVVTEGNEPAISIYKSIGFLEKE
jgi:GNAT superfamily N-acetyltransferase